MSAGSGHGVSTPKSGLSSTYVRFLDTLGNPIEGGLVTISIDTATGQVEDITYEEA